MWLFLAATLVAGVGAQCPNRVRTWDSCKNFPDCCEDNAECVRVASRPTTYQCRVKAGEPGYIPLCFYADKRMYPNCVGYSRRGYWCKGTSCATGACVADCSVCARMLEGFIPSETGQCILPSSTPAPLTPQPTAVPLTLEPTTAVPTTPVPLTPEPTTAVPATQEPTTAVPATPEPTTAAPPTSAPTTPVPPTRQPVTDVPHTPEPMTAVPATQEPTTAVPATLEPTTAVPLTPEPTTAAPPTSAPTTAVPLTPQPVTDVPPTVVPPTLAPIPTIPATPEPTTDVPSTPQPTTGVPATGTPTDVPETPAPFPMTPVPTTSVPATWTPRTAAPGACTDYPKWSASYYGQVLGCDYFAEHPLLTEALCATYGTSVGAGGLSGQEACCACKERMTPEPPVSPAPAVGCRDVDGWRVATTDYRLISCRDFATDPKGLCALHEGDAPETYCCACRDFIENTCGGRYASMREACVDGCCTGKLVCLPSSDHPAAPRRCGMVPEDTFAPGTSPSPVTPPPGDCSDRTRRDGGVWTVTIYNSVMPITATCADFAGPGAVPTAALYPCSAHALTTGDDGLTVQEACCACRPAATPTPQGMKPNMTVTETATANGTAPQVIPAIAPANPDAAAVASALAEPTVGNTGVLGVVAAASAVLGAGPGLAMRQVVALDETCFVTSAGSTASAVVVEAPGRVGGAQALGGRRADLVIPGGGAASNHELREGDAMQRRRFSSYLHPTQMHVLGMSTAGMVVGNLLLTACISIAALLISAYVPRGTVGVATLSRMGLLHMPSAALAPFLYFLHGASLGAFYLFFQTPTWAAYFVGLVAFVAMVLIVFWLALQLRLGVKLGEATYVADPAARGAWTVFVAGAGAWTSLAGSTWADCFAMVIRLYKPKLVWFAVADIIVSLCMSAVHALQTVTYRDCGMLKLLSAAVFGGLLALTLGYWPHARTRDSFVWVTVLVLQTGSATCYAIGFYNIDDSGVAIVTETIARCLSAGSLLATAALFVMAVNVIAEVCVVGYLLHSKRHERIEGEVDTMFRTEAREAANDGDVCAVDAVGKRRVATVDEVGAGGQAIQTPAGAGPSPASSGGSGDAGPTGIPRSAVSEELQDVLQQSAAIVDPTDAGSGMSSDAGASEEGSCSFSPRRDRGRDTPSRPPPHRMRTLDSRERTATTVTFADMLEATHSTAREAPLPSPRTPSLYDASTRNSTSAGWRGGERDRDSSTPSVVHHIESPTSIRPLRGSGKHLKRGTQGFPLTVEATTPPARRSACLGADAFGRKKSGDTLLGGPNPLILATHGSQGAELSAGCMSGLLAHLHPGPVVTPRACDSRSPLALRGQSLLLPQRVASPQDTASISSASPRAVGENGKKRALLASTRSPLHAHLSGCALADTPLSPHVPAGGGPSGGGRDVQILAL